MIILVIITRSILNGIIEAPPSKSYAIRQLVLAGLGEGRAVLKNIPSGEDIEDATSLLRAAGAKVVNRGRDMIVDPRSSLDFNFLKLKGSATVLRIAIAIAASYEGRKVIEFGDSLSKRPVQQEIDALVRAGSNISREGNSIIVESKAKGKMLEIDGNVSSQFITALTYFSIAGGEEVRIRLRTDMVSKTYYEMTKEVIGSKGIIVETDGNDITIIPKKIRNSLTEIPGDFALSGYFGAICARNGDETTITNLNYESKGDSRIIDMFGAAGIESRIVGKEWKIEGPNDINAQDIDMRDVPDLVPVISSLLSTSNGESRLRNIAHLEYKESNRIEEILNILRIGGIMAKYNAGTLSIKGGELRKFSYKCPGDHRMAMMAISLQATCGGTTTNESCMGKSYPNFLGDFRSLGGNFLGG